VNPISRSQWNGGHGQDSGPPEVILLCPLSAAQSRQSDSVLTLGIQRAPAEPPHRESRRHICLRKT
jgi:hypothetical protein